jgi:uncharacterized protein
MTKTIIALIVACLLSTAAHAAKPSFKCTKGLHEAEALICKDDELAKLDVSLSQLYGLELKNTPVSEKKRLKAEQSGWVKGRNDCWKAKDKKSCIKAEYQTRISELKDR